ncbi:Beta-amylase 1 protein, partial [Thalictrum thalictroides]
IPLPKWATEEIDKDPDLTYTDQWGRKNYEYISLGCDTLPVLKGRTPIQCYADFMRAFRDNFQHLLGDTIVEIQVGMGRPARERFDTPHSLSRMEPGNFQELELSNVMTRYIACNISFSIYDRYVTSLYMRSSLKAATEVAGKPEWGTSGPTDAGEYNNWPEDTQFFRRANGGWDSPYG